MRFFPELLRAPDGVDGAGGDDGGTTEQDTGAEGAQGAEGGAAEDDGKAQGGIEPVDGPGSGRGKLRKQLEGAVAEDRKAREAQDKKEASKFRGQRGKDGVVAGAEGAGDGAEGAEGDQQQQQVKPPEGLTKEAVAEWAKTPPVVQQAFVKRVEDMEKGVTALKTRYADLDGALAPHIESIRSHNRTPAQAVAQLFSWFKALEVNPAQAFPALAASFNYDWEKLKTLPAMAAAAGGQQQQGTQAQQDIMAKLPEELKPLFGQLLEKVGSLENQLGQKVGSLETAMQTQSQQKTNEVLAIWSKDKPHFEGVRLMMARLIQSGAVPLKDGQVDLDGAYDMACNADPTTRAALLADARAAEDKKRKDAAALEKKAQQDQAEKARRAGIGVAGGAPGAPRPVVNKTAGRGKSVKESIQDAITELANQ